MFQKAGQIQFGLTMPISNPKMPVDTRKCRMISLRLSPNEYDAMHALFPKFGAKSVSDFARLAMQRTLTNSFADGALISKMNELDERLRYIEARISALLESSNPQSGNPQ
jgi:hypothetical protein